MATETVPAGDTSSSLQCDPLSALKSAQSALATAERMTEAVLAIFKTLELDAILASEEHENGYELFCAVEACLEKTKRVAFESLSIVGRAVGSMEVSHG